MPAQIGRYKIVRKLGEGSFGVVYQGHDSSLNRNVAIKLLRADKLVQKPGAKGTTVVQRFLREAQALAQLLHGNIVPVFELGEHEGSPFIVSAFIPGQDLASLIAEHEDGLESGRAVALILQLLDALTHAHAQHIIHRDIKPGNAMVNSADTVYLMDFGLAGWVEQDESRMTAAGTIMGTPSYMPPEQARGEMDQVGPAADQYSAGVALYELLTGKVPFSGHSIAVVLAQVLSAQPTPLREWRADIDPELEVICLRSLAKKPEDRYADCREFARVLRAWLDGRGKTAAGPVDALSKKTLDRTAAAGVSKRSTVGGVSVKEPTIEGQPQRQSSTIAPTGATSRKTWLAAALAGLVLLLIVAATVVILGSRRPEQKPSPSKDPKGIFKQRDE